MMLKSTDGTPLSGGESDRPEDVMICTFGGELRKTFRSKGGDEAVSLPAGSYIVCIGEKRFKVIL